MTGDSLNIVAILVVHEPRADRQRLHFAPGQTPLDRLWKLCKSAVITLARKQTAGTRLQFGGQRQR